jgi:hypothetical protein
MSSRIISILIIRDTKRISDAEVHAFRFLPVAVELGLDLFQSNLTSPKCIFRLALVVQVVAQPALKAAHAQVEDGTLACTGRAVKPRASAAVCACSALQGYLHINRAPVARVLKVDRFR